MAALSSGVEESATIAFAPAPTAAVLGVTAPQTVLSLVSTFLHRWESLPAHTIIPAITCERERQGIVVTASVLPGGRYLATDLIEAADVVAASLAALAVRGEDVILPHAAAVESPAGLLLLLADTTGGKSTLALTLAAAGWRLYGDDRLGLCRKDRRSFGIALGLAPKLRLPLPASAAGLAAFVSIRASRKEATLIYLALGSEEQARAEVKAPVAACLLLERDGTQPLLEPAAPSQLVKILAESAAAPWLSAAEVLAAAVSHGDLPCYRLHYAEAVEAAPLLIDRFGMPAEPSLN